MLGQARGLPSSFVVERYVGVSLPFALCVPGRFAMPNQRDKCGHSYEIPDLMGSKSKDAAERDDQFFDGMDRVAEVEKQILPGFARPSVSGTGNAQMLRCHDLMPALDRHVPGHKEALRRGRALRE